MKKLAPFLLSLVLAAVVGWTVRYAIREEIIPWDVADAQGHGPDYGGLEWRGALEGQASAFSIRVAIISFLAVSAVLHVVRKKNA